MLTLDELTQQLQQIPYPYSRELLRWLADIKLLPGTGEYELLGLLEYLIEDRQRLFDLSVKMMTEVVNPSPIIMVTSQEEQDRLRLRLAAKEVKVDKP